MTAGVHSKYKVLNLVGTVPVPTYLDKRAVRNRGGATECDAHPSG